MESEPNTAANSEPKLEPKEAQALITFLNRTQIQGNESESHAYLKSKLAAIINYKPSAELSLLEGAKGEVRE